VPEGSPLTPLLRVVVAAFRKRADAAELYEVKPAQSGKKRLLCHTYQLR
jgi:peptide/histidine transporter 3/4